jgi:hypothetical protein
MTRLKLRFVPFTKSLEPLYEVYDDKGHTYCEPKPWDQADEERKTQQAFVDARELEDAAVIGMLGGFV